MNGLLEKRLSVWFLKLKLMLCGLGPGSCVSHICRTACFHFQLCGKKKRPAKEAKDGLCLLTGRKCKTKQTTKRWTQTKRFLQFMVDPLKLPLKYRFDVLLMVWIHLARGVGMRTYALILSFFFDTKADILHSVFHKRASIQSCKRAASSQLPAPHTASNKHSLSLVATCVQGSSRSFGRRWPTLLQALSRHRRVAHGADVQVSDL